MFYFQFSILHFTSYIVTPSGTGVGQEVTGTGAEVTAQSGISHPLRPTHGAPSP